MLTFKQFCEALERHNLVTRKQGKAIFSGPNKPKLTPRNKEAIEDYRIDSEGINYTLRHGKENEKGTHQNPIDGSTATEHHRTIKHIDKATTHQIPRPLTIYRGISGKEHDKISELKPGSTFKNRTYTSTTISHREARDFTEDHEDGSKGHILRIHTRAGDRGHAIEPEYWHFNKSEREVLLHRGTHFRVGKTFHSGGYKYTDVHVIGNDMDNPDNNHRSL